MDEPLTPVDPKPISPHAEKWLSALAATSITKLTDEYDRGRILLARDILKDVSKVDKAKLEKLAGVLDNRPLRFEDYAIGQAMLASDILADLTR